MRLLVSVVSGEEAQRALTGGADIIDVKDPGEGALGAPAPRVLSDVVRAVGDERPGERGAGRPAGPPAHRGARRAGRRAERRRATSRSGCAGCATSSARWR